MEKCKLHWRSKKLGKLRTSVVKTGQPAKRVASLGSAIFMRGYAWRLGRILCGVMLRGSATFLHGVVVAPPPPK